MITATNNPYSTPKAETILSTSAQVNPESYYVDGKNLVIRDGAELPNLCIKTGEPLSDGKRRKKTLYWAHPAWALLIFAALIVYAIVYLCVRKKVTFHYCLSASAIKKRFIGMTSCLLLTFGGIVAAIYFMVADDPNGSNSMFIVAGFITFFLGLIIAAIFSNSLRIKKHHDGWFHLAGTGKKFRAAIQAQQV